MEPVAANRDPIIRCPGPPLGCGQEYLIYVRRDDCWVCPRCGGQWWRRAGRLYEVRPDPTEEAIEEYRRKKEAKDAEKAREILLWSVGSPPPEPVSLSFAGPIKKGGSRKSGRRWKRRRRRPKRRYGAPSMKFTRPAAKNVQQKEPAKS